MRFSGQSVDAVVSGGGDDGGGDDGGRLAGASFRFGTGRKAFMPCTPAKRHISGHSTTITLARHGKGYGGDAANPE